MPKQPMPPTVADLRFRAAALRMRGYRWDRITKTYTKTIRIADHRKQTNILAAEVKRAYYDREDFLDFVDYMDRKAVRQLSQELAHRAFVENSKWKID